MLRRYFHARLAAKALALLTLLSLTLITPIRPFASASVAGQVGKDKEKENNGKTPDPCQQLLKANGKAEGLSKRCEVAGTGGGAAKGDFNGDSFADLAVGSPREDRNGVGQVGSVNIIYGSDAGLSATGDQFFDEKTFGFPYGTDDHFGSALASGDFNNDGYSDLAIGMPDWDYTSGSIRLPDIGRVFVIYGSMGGLDTATARTLGSTESGRAGAALVWADFNGDGFGDLAVGAPDASARGANYITCIEFPSTTLKAGVVQVFYGTPAGLTTSGRQAFHEGPRFCGNPENVGGEPQDSAKFGSVLAAGRFKGGRVSSLVVGVPLDDVKLGLFDTRQDAGSVVIIPGSSDNGLQADNSEFLTQGFAQVQGEAETGDQFGRALATGDFDGDGRDDLAVGVPYEDLDNNSKADAGAVQIFFGSLTTGIIRTDNDRFISQANLSGVAVEAGDLFGWALAAGDFDGDGRKDLAVGTPGEDIGSIPDAGLVTVIYGSVTGPDTALRQHWSQNATGIYAPETAGGNNGAEAYDRFGYALSVWSYGRGREADLAVGVPYEDVLSALDNTQKVNAGGVDLIYGSPTGLNAAGHQFWTQDSPDIKDASQPEDRFGSVLY